MRNEFAVAIVLFLVSANWGLGQELKPVPPPLPQREEPRQESSADLPRAAIDHLLKAAEHLEAAGRPSEAARLRDDAKRLTLRDDLLGQKEAELECLQQEVDRLRALLGQDAGVLLEFAIVEVDREKLGLKAREFDKLIGRREPVSSMGTSESGQTSTGVAAANPLKLPLFRELRDKGVLRVISQPTLTTAARRTARFLDGGEIPFLRKTDDGVDVLDRAWHGMKIEVRAVPLLRQRIRLDVDFEVRTVDGSQEPRTEPLGEPAFVSNGVKTQVAMELGETLMLQTTPTRSNADGRPEQKTGEDADRLDQAGPHERLIFITPRLLQPPRPAAIVPAASESDAPLPENLGPDDWNVFGPPLPVLKRRTARD